MGSRNILVQNKIEYIKGIKNTLANTMSRLIKIIPDTKPPPEPEGYEFGYYAFEELDPIKTTKDEEDICDIPTRRSTNSC